MTTAQSELCRITVHGPVGKVDLAVPQSLSVASVLPVLLRHTGGPARPAANDSWVLQRLGEPPQDLAGTPESLDWQDGQEFFLRTAEDALPELDFDDVGDAMATAVVRHPGRWRPEFNKGLFFGGSVAALVVLAVALLDAGQPLVTMIGAAVAAVGLLVGAILAGRRDKDGAVVVLLGVAAGVFAAASGDIAVSTANHAPALSSLPVLGASAALVVAAGVLLAARAVGAGAVPTMPFCALVILGAIGALAQWLRQGLAITPIQVAGSIGTGLLVLLVFAPRISIRLARIRGPQLPRTAEELQRDVEPFPAGQMITRTGYADSYLTAIVLASAIVFGCTYPYLLDGSFGSVLATLFAVSALLRARAFLGAWQRVPLIVTGALGIGVVATGLFVLLPGQTKIIVLILFAWVFVALLMGMLRPPTVRLLPIWGHLANVGETLTALAVVPVLLQLFGVYGSAAGLFG